MFIRDQRGIALPLALVVMLILSILGAAVYQYSTTQFLTVAREDKRMQAYYIARSGAEATAKYITGNPVDAVNIINKKTSPRVSFGNGNFEVHVTGTVSDGVIDGPVTIKSTGFVDNVSQTVTIVLEQSEDGNPGGGTGGGGGSGGGSYADALDMAVFATDGINIDGGTFNGSIGTNATYAACVDLDWGTKINGDVYVGPGGNVNTAIKVPPWSNFIIGSRKNINVIRNYSLPPFVTFPEPEKKSSFVLSGGTNGKTIDQDGWYPEIEIKNNLIQPIDTGTGDRIIRVSRLKLTNGHIKLLGTGRLLLYVDESFTIDSGSTINNGGASERLIIYYSGVNKIYISGSQKIIGTVYIKNADIQLDRGGMIIGNIISGGSNIIMSGGVSANVRAIYAPSATVSLIEGAVLNGSIIARYFNSSGGIVVTHNPGIIGFPIPADQLGYPSASGQGGSGGQTGTAFKKKWN